MASSNITLRALGLNFSPNALELNPGSLLEADNIIIRRDDVIESRRGFKLFGEEIPNEELSKQVFIYRDRILRHYEDRIAYQDGILNDGVAKFTPFGGNFLETKTGLRIKGLQEKNGNFYFTSIDGVKKISAADASQFVQADPLNPNNENYITNAGGIKALDLNANLIVSPGKSDGFLPENSSVAYKMVWGKVDANNVELLGTPSERVIVYNDSKNLMKIDFLRLLTALDNLNIASSLINDGDYYSSLSVDSDSSVSFLRDNMVSLASKLDADLKYATSTPVGTNNPYEPLIITTSTCSSGLISVNFSSATARYFSIADKIFLKGFASGGVSIDAINTSQIITNVIPPASFSIQFTANGYTTTTPNGVSGIIASESGTTITTTEPHGLKQNQIINISTLGNYTIASVTGEKTLILSSAPGASAVNKSWNIIIDSPTASTIIESYTYRSIAAPAEIDEAIEPRGTAAQLESLRLYLTEIIDNLKSEGTDVISTSELASTGIGNFTNTTTANVRLEFTVPYEIDSSYFYRIYRTDIKTAIGVQTVEDSIIPSTDYYFLSQITYNSNNKTTSNTIIYDDVDSFNVNLTDPETNALKLYTSGSFNGDQNPNDYVPFANDINSFNSYTFYASTKLKQLKGLNLLGISRLKDALDLGTIPKLLISDNTGNNQAVFKFVKGVSQVSTLTINGIIPSLTTINFNVLINGDELTATTTHGFTVGDIVKTGASVPTGFTANTNYVVVETPTTTKFKLALSLNNTPISTTISGPFALTTNRNYFDINSANNIFKYRFYYDISGSDVPPQSAGKILNRVYLKTNTIANISEQTSRALDSIIEIFSATSAIIGAGPNYLVTINYLEDGTSDNITVAAGLSSVVTPAYPTPGVGEDITQKQIALPSDDTIIPEAQLILTLKSLARIMNRNTANINTNIDNYLYYDSVSKGNFVIEGSIFKDSPFYILTNTPYFGESFSPFIISLTGGSVQPEIVYTLSSSTTDTITTTTNHGFSVGDVVSFSGSRPPEISAATKYYVIEKTPNTFKISTTSGGLALSLTAGSYSGSVWISENNNSILTFPTPHGFSNNDEIVIFDLNGSGNENSFGVFTVKFLTNTTLKAEGLSVVSNATQFKYSNTKTATKSDNYRKKNRIYYSKFGIPEAVYTNPFVGYFIDIGSEEKEILRIFPLRESLFILKEDGLYRLSGQTAPFNVSLFDSSCILIAPDSVSVSGNVIYCWTRQGITIVSESGTSIVSRPIDTEILRIASSDFVNFKSSTFGVGYESDNSYIVWTVESPTDEIATQAYRYSALTGTWTKYTKSNTCGLVNPSDDKLYLGAGDVPYLEQERKQFNRYDYADREYIKQIGPNSIQNNTIKFSSVVDIFIGDVIVQEQYLTVSGFNALLKKLDNDPDLVSNNYYSTLAIGTNSNLRSAILALATKLTTETTNDYLTKINDITNITIESISLETPIIIKSTNHGLITGRVINISGSNAFTNPDLDGNFIVTKIDNDHFSVPITLKSYSDPGIPNQPKWSTVPQNFYDIYTCYNNIINQLNSDLNVGFSNYQIIEAASYQESTVVGVNRITKIVTVDTILPYVQGPAISYASIPCNVVYSPITFGDPLMFKHVREATMMFANKAFTSASLSFSTDLLPAFIKTDFEGDGKGLFGHDEFGFNFFGGTSNSAPFRTYVPLNCQRCRYLNIKFNHSNARERFAIYGLTLTGKMISTRAYR